jgi:hypothetical protein
MLVRPAWLCHLDLGQQKPATVGANLGNLVAIRRAVQAARAFPPVFAVAQLETSHSWFPVRVRRLWIQIED